MDYAWTRNQQLLPRNLHRQVSNQCSMLYLSHGNVFSIYNPYTLVAYCQSTIYSQDVGEGILGMMGVFFPQIQQLVTSREVLGIWDLPSLHKELCIQLKYKQKWRQLNYDIRRYSFQQRSFILWAEYGLKSEPTDIEATSIQLTIIPQTKKHNYCEIKLASLCNIPITMIFFAVKPQGSLYLFKIPTKLFILESIQGCLGHM